MARVMLLGIGASLFFAFTFVLNRQMSVAGGSWLWSASLRFLFMLPLLGAIVLAKGELAGTMADIKRKPIPWMLWSTVGFGLFYSCLCAASDYGPSWLIAATWQITIIAGALLSPLFHREAVTELGLERARHRIPKRALVISSLILCGIALLQLRGGREMKASNTLAGFGLVALAAFAYPLGNRKMMELCGDRLTTTQRIFGMTLCSLPFWIVVSIVAYARQGFPSAGQLIQAGFVALFSGIVATFLFFKATELVRGDIHALAAVESTQAGEVVFTLMGGVLIFGDELPSLRGLLGLVLIVLGMLANSLSSGAAPRRRGRQGGPGSRGSRDPLR